MSAAVYLDDVCYALGSRKLAVADSVAAGGTRTAAGEFVDAGFRYHHLCDDDESAYDLARAAVGAISDRLGDVDAVVYATCIPAGRRPAGRAPGVPVAGHLGRPRGRQQLRRRRPPGSPAAVARGVPGPAGGRLPGVLGAHAAAPAAVPGGTRHAAVPAADVRRTHRVQRAGHPPGPRRHQQRRRRAAGPDRGHRRPAGRRRRAAGLVGDLNAEPHTPEMATLLERYADAWALAGEGPGFTYSASEPRKRIDYVLVSADVQVTDAQVVWSPASDDLAVVADLLLPGEVGVGAR